MHAEIYAKEFLINNCCDVVIHGEGEYVFLEIIKAYLAKKAFACIDFVSTNENGLIKIASEKAVVDDLSLLPAPARDMVNQELYSLSEISNQIYIGSSNKTFLFSFKNSTKDIIPPS